VGAPKSGRPVFSQKRAPRFFEDAATPVPSREVPGPPLLGPPNLLHIWALGEGEYTVRGLAKALGLHHTTTTTALRALVKRGLLEVVRPPAGRRPGTYRVRSGRAASPGEASLSPAPEEAAR